MPYESNLIDKILVYLQISMFDHNPYFLNGVILSLVAFWICFVFSILKFIKIRKTGNPTLKFKIFIAVFGILFLLSVILFFLCCVAIWYAWMSV